MGYQWAAAEAAQLRLYRPRHAAPPRPVRAAWSLRARAGCWLARAGLRITEAGAALQLAAGIQAPRAWHA